MLLSLVSQSTHLAEPSATVFHEQLAADRNAKNPLRTGALFTRLVGSNPVVKSRGDLVVNTPIAIQHPSQRPRPPRQKYVFRGGSQLAPAPGTVPKGGNRSIPVVAPEKIEWRL